MITTTLISIASAILFFIIGYKYANNCHKKQKTILINKVATVVKSIIDSVGDTELTPVEILEIKKKAYALITDDGFDVELLIPSDNPDNANDDKGRGTQRPYL